MSARPRIYVVVVTACFLAALIVTAVAGAAPGPHLLLKACPWLALSVLAEALVVHQEEGTSGHLSFSAAVHTASAIILGPFLAALIAAVGVVVVDGGGRKNVYNVALNASMLGAAAGVGGLVYERLGGEVNAPLAAMVALAALVVCRFLANTLLFAGVVWASTGSSIITLIEDELWHNGLSGIGEGCLGVLLGLSVEHGLDYALPFLVPLLAALYVARSNYEQLWSETHKALDTFVEVIDERDPSTARHSERVTSYVEEFCTYLGLGQRQAVRLAEAARYHDLGKVVVDVATLAASRRLEPHELAAIRSHARVSARLLKAFAFAQDTAPLVELHHERFDGNGYYGVPRGRIPIEAHVLIIADSFDAMTSNRAYRPALTLQEAAAELRDKAGLQFHPMLAPAFAAMMEGLELTDIFSPNGVRELRDAFATPARIRLRRARPRLRPMAWALLAITIPLAGMSVPEWRLESIVAGGACALVGFAVHLSGRRSAPVSAEVGEAEAIPDNRGDDDRRCAFLVDLGCFERIRTAAGQLTAERTLVQAAAEVGRIVGSDGTSERIGDDRFILRVDEARWHKIIPRLGPALAEIRVPRRVDPIAIQTTVLDRVDEKAA